VLAGRAGVGVILAWCFPLHRPRYPGHTQCSHSSSVYTDHWTQLIIREWFKTLWEWRVEIQSYQVTWNNICYCRQRVREFLRTFKSEARCLNRWTTISTKCSKISNRVVPVTFLQLKDQTCSTMSSLPRTFTLSTHSSQLSVMTSWWTLDQRWPTPSMMRTSGAGSPCTWWPSWWQSWATSSSSLVLCARGGQETPDTISLSIYQ